MSLRSQAHATTDLLISKPGYEEPFVPTAAVSSRDQRELSEALASAQEARTSADDFSALTLYLAAHPHSPFLSVRYSLLT